MLLEAAFVSTPRSTFSSTVPSVWFFIHSASFHIYELASHLDWHPVGLFASLFALLMAIYIMTFLRMSLPTGNETVEPRLIGLPSGSRRFCWVMYYANKLYPFSSCIILYTLFSCFPVYPMSRPVTSSMILVVVQE
jgi:hypothetical protein